MKIKADIYSWSPSALPYHGKPLAGPLSLSKARQMAQALVLFCPTTSLPSKGYFPNSNIGLLLEKSFSSLLKTNPSTVFWHSTLLPWVVLFFKVLKKLIALILE